MAHEQEVEVKFYVQNLYALEVRLKKLGASLLQPRIFELNLRFDTPEGGLSKARQVLRLRQDTQALLTFKGPAQDRSDVAFRQEIEFGVSDFTAAQHLLEALGYQVQVVYEKYRAVYALDGLEVTLDEMPYGNFAEIEGPDPTSIQDVAVRLGLMWENRVIDSYVGLFEKLKQTLNMEARDLSFQNFQSVRVQAGQLGVSAADRS
jgi:adenylate cyclase, class 2